MVSAIKHPVPDRVVICCFWHPSTLRGCQTLQKCRAVSPWPWPWSREASPWPW